jgi:hypothetical protein
VTAFSQSVADRAQSNHSLWIIVLTLSPRRGEVMIRKDNIVAPWHWAAKIHLFTEGDSNWVLT